MSTRERWIVYPLLFFSLCFDILPRLVKTAGAPSEIQCRTIDCQELRVKTINGRPYVSQPVAIMVPSPAVPRAVAAPSAEDQAEQSQTEAPPVEPPEE
jgi:hypothetical protein